MTGILLQDPPRERPVRPRRREGPDRPRAADAKNRALKEAGAIVPASFDSYGDEIRGVYERLLAEGKVREPEEPEIPKIPMDYAKAVSEGIVRKSTNLICTISDDRGEEVLYAGKPLSRVLEDGMGIGGVIGLLWFKKEIPPWAAEFIELVLQIVADHGPAVSAAHNAIVASCAGKDLITSLASGLLTIGPRSRRGDRRAAREFMMARAADYFPAELVRRGVIFERQT